MPEAMGVRGFVAGLQRLCRFYLRNKGNIDAAVALLTFTGKVELLAMLAAFSAICEGLEVLNPDGPG